jgi:predicted ABC-type ATPase
MNKPVFYLLAGPNGAGKSTLYKTLVQGGQIAKDAEFVNADLYEAAHLSHITDPESRSKMASKWAESRRSALISQGQSFVSETVFSHESKLDLITQAKQAGFLVLLFVVALDQPQELINRVHKRVSEGGHSVPEARILSRYPRTLANLKRAVRIADAAILYDSSNIHQAVAQCKGDQTFIVRQPLPQWAMTVLATT